METFGDSAETEPACRRVHLSALIDELKGHYQNLILRKDELVNDLVLRKELVRSEIHQSEFGLKTPDSAGERLNQPEIDAIKRRVELDIEASRKLNQYLEKLREGNPTFRVADDNLPVANVERFWALVRDLSNELPTVPREIGILCFSYRIMDLEMKFSEEHGELMFQSRTLRKKNLERSWFNPDSEKKARRAIILQTIRKEKTPDISRLEAAVKRRWNPFHDLDWYKLTQLNSSIEKRVNEIFEKDELPRIKEETRKDNEFRELLSRKEDELEYERRRINAVKRKLERMVDNVASLCHANIPVSFNAQRFTGAEEETEFLEQALSKGLKSKIVFMRRGTKFSQ